MSATDQAIIPIATDAPAAPRPSEAPPPPQTIFPATAMALISFGLAPLFVWPARLRQRIDHQRETMLSITDRLHGKAPPGLVDVARRSVRLLKLSSVLHVGIVGCAVLILLSLLNATNWQPPNVADVMAATYKYGRAHPRMLSEITISNLHQIWIKLLVVGYVAMWLGNKFHELNFRRATMAINHALGAAGAAPVAAKPLGLGIQLPWLIPSIVLWIGGAAWGVPFALAASLHSRQSEQADQTLRDLQVRLDEISAVSTAACSASNCRSPLPTHASYCPRCGRSRASME